MGCYNFISCVLGAHRQLARTDDVKMLGRQYAKKLSEMGLEKVEEEYRDDSFILEASLIWSVEGSTFQETLVLRLVGEAKGEQEISWGELSIPQEAVLRAIKVVFPEAKFTARSFAEDCGCKSIYPVAILERSAMGGPDNVVLGDVIAEVAGTGYGEQCSEHR